MKQLFKRYEGAIYLTILLCFILFCAVLLDYFINYLFN